MSVVEVRFRLSNINEARQSFKGLNEDTKKFKEAMQAAGVPLVQQKVLLQQLQKEQRQSAREALGIVKNTKPLGDIIKNAVVQAHLLTGAFDKAKQGLEALRRLGKVKGLEESTADAIELDDKFEEIKEKLDLIGKPGQFADLKRNISEISRETGIPQMKLLEGVGVAQDAQSAGAALALDNNGELLRKSAITAKAGRVEDMGAAIKANVDLQKNLGLSGGEMLRAPGIIRAGEQAGAVTAKQIMTEFGGVMTQMKQLQGTSGEVALRRGQALAQVIGSAPGISGDVSKAQNRMENLIAKLVDPEYRKRIKHYTGRDTLDAKGNLRDVGDIFGDFASAEAKGKLKQKDIFSIFKDAQAREGFLGAYKGRDQLKPLENVNYRVGDRFISSAYENQLRSTKGRLDLSLARDEDTHLKKLREKAPAIVHGADLMGKFGAESPGTAAAVGAVGDLAGHISPKLKMGVEAGAAALVLSGSEPAGVARERMLSMREDRMALDQANEDIKRILATPPTVINNITVGDGLQAKITQDVVSSKAKAQGKGQSKSLPGR